MGSFKHAAAADEPRKGFFERWFESMAESRLRHAQHELGGLGPGAENPAGESGRDGTAPERKPGTH